MNTAKTVPEAIERSALLGEIVRVPWTPANERELLQIRDFPQPFGLDDAVKNGDEFEAWGEDDDGREWRVHLSR
jgi:hypothetical protein